MEKFTVGLALGMLAGAIVVANSYKVRSIVKKSQDEIKNKVDEMLDEKIEMLENMSAQNTQTQTKAAPKKGKA